jgi:hypothetical protein
MLNITIRDQLIASGAIRPASAVKNGEITPFDNRAGLPAATISWLRPEPEPAPRAEPRSRRRRRKWGSRVRT